MDYLGINSGYPAFLRSQVTEDDVLGADWGKIRKNLIGNK